MDTEENIETLRSIFDDRYPDELYTSVLLYHPAQNLNVIIEDLSSDTFNPSFYLDMIGQGERSRGQEDRSRGYGGSPGRGSPSSGYDGYGGDYDSGSGLPSYDESNRGEFP